MWILIDVYLLLLLDVAVIYFVSFQQNITVIIGEIDGEKKQSQNNIFVFGSRFLNTDERSVLLHTELIKLQHSIK